MLPTASGQWWQYRGDERLSGRSAARGNLIEPATLWRHSVAGRETLLAAALRDGPATVSLPTADIPTSPEGLAWGPVVNDWRVPGPYNASWYDLDGDGRLTACSVNANQKIGKLLPDVPGLQLVECEPKGYPKVPGVYKGTVRLKVRQNGEWETRWEVETETLIWQSEPIFGDFDGDGRTEIALLPWFRLNVLDAETGALKERCNFLAEDESENPGHGGRAYGWFGAVDVDGDGQTEYVIVEDFIRFAAVIGRREGQLRRLWLKVWEPAPVAGAFVDPAETVVVRVNPEPVQDIDGDGRLEILASIYNLSRDNCWHIVALDPLTGETAVDLPGQFLSGLFDVNGDGLPELLCTGVGPGPRLPEPSDLSILSLKGGEARTLWTLPDSAFVVADAGHPPHDVNSGAALGGQTVLHGPLAPDQPPVFFTRRVLDRATAAVEVTCQRGRADAAPQALATWVGPNLEPLAVRSRAGASPTLLLRAAAPEGEPAEVQCTAGTAATVVWCSQRAPAPTSPLVVGRPTPEQAPIIVVQGPNETVEAFRPTADGATAQVWRVPGRGMTCNNYFEGVLLADLHGGGRLSVVLGTRGPGDCARLSALSAEDGRTVWSRDFPDYPGTPPPWNVPGLMYWQGAHFRDPDRMDLLVQMRRVGGESYLLDGRDGATVWEQKHGRTGRDFGRWWMAMYDFDGDRLDDILNIYPDMFCVARGTDGKLLVAEESVKYVDIYAYYADCLVADLLGAGEPQVLYLHESVTALLEGNGRRVWKLDHPHPQDWRNQAAFGDLDGDGRLELCFPGAMGDAGREFQCRDAATGALKWCAAMPDEALTFPAAADINGDGRDECVLTIADTLYAVGATGPDSGGVLWTHTLPGRLGPVAVADVLGGGQVQIVVSCADGYVYGIGAVRTIGQ
jgi:outer membrane protein assembly factor BamB